MSLDKDSLVNLLGSQNADFLENQFQQPSEYAFINKYIKTLKKKISVAVSFDKVINDEITYNEFEDSLKSDVSININYKGYFVKGSITDNNFYQLLSFLNCNIVPRISGTDNALIFNNEQYRLFVNNFDSEDKNIAILFKKESKEDMSILLGLYFDDIEEIKEMDETAILNLQIQDIDSLSYKTEYSDYNTGANLVEIQDSLYKTYSYNPVDYLLTLGLIYRLKQLGLDRSYITYIATNNRGFNILNSNTHIKLNQSLIESILGLGYIDDDYSTLDFAEVQHVVVLLNKADTVTHAIAEQKIEIISTKTKLPTYAITAKFHHTLDKMFGYLREYIAHHHQEEGTIISNVRHAEALQNTKISLQKVTLGLESGLPSDLVAMDIREALYHLGLITGQVATDDLLESIFSKFCIGK